MFLPLLSQACRDPVHVQRSTRNNEINGRLGIFRFPIVLLRKRKTLSKPFFSSVARSNKQQKVDMIENASVTIVIVK